MGDWSRRATARGSAFSADMTSLDREGGRSRVTKGLESFVGLLGVRLVRARGSASHNGRLTVVPVLSGWDGLLSR